MIIGSFCKIPSISDSDTFVFFACPLAPALMWRKVCLELLRWTGREASELHFISSQPRVRKKRKDSTSTRSKAALLFKLFFPAFLPDCCRVFCLFCFYAGGAAQGRGSCG